MAKPIAHVLIFLVCTIVASAQEDFTSCISSIPAGMYNKFPDRFYDPEPQYGGICVRNITVPTQRIVWMCLPQYCSSNDCNCNTTGLAESYQTDITLKTIYCYIPHRIDTYFVYECCPGYHNINRTCIPYDLCRDNYLGCKFACSTSNNISTCTCPTGFELNPTDNKTCRDINECATVLPPCDDVCTNTNGSYRCSCNTGRIIARDGHTCTDLPSTTDPTHLPTPAPPLVVAPQPISAATAAVPTNWPSPAPVADSSTATPGGAFPYQYIIAIVLGSLVLLALLLVLVYCLACRRRKEQPVEIFFVGKDEKEVEVVKKIDEVDPYDITFVGYGEKKTKESDYATIDLGPPSSPTIGLPVLPPSRGLADRGVLAKPNIYSSLSGAAKIPVPKVSESDLNSDYAEIGEPMSSEL